MKKNRNIDALLLASSLFVATSAQALPTKVGKVTPPSPPTSVCGEVRPIISKIGGAAATDLFTDCHDMADKCLQLLQQNSRQSYFLELRDATTQAAARECMDKFEAELFGED